MKKFFFYATLVAMVLAMAMPMQAQTRKDKKAAKKAKWEMEQKHQREEAELRHQIHMDSIQNAKRLADEKAARKEAERRAAERQEKRTRKSVTLPCKGAEYKANSEKLRAFASREGLDTDAAQQAAYISARKELTAMIEVSIQSMTTDYLNAKERVKTKDQERKLEGLTLQSIERMINLATPVCEEYESYFDDDDNEVFVCYVVMEIDREAALKSLHKGLSDGAGDVIQGDYERFKEDFDRHFSKEEDRKDAE